MFIIVIPALMLLWFLDSGNLEASKKSGTSANSGTSVGDSSISLDSVTIAKGKDFLF